MKDNVLILEILNTTYYGNNNFGIRRTQQRNQETD